MPKELEAKLKAEATAKGFSEERKNRYVYGTMRKTGWIPSTQKKKFNAVEEATKKIKSKK